MPETNIVTGEIKLSDQTKALTQADSVKIRVYWEWNEDITNPTFENTSIEVTSTVKQKI